MEDVLVTGSGGNTLADQEVHVLFTMDCEPARSEVTAHAAQMSPSGAEDYKESERTIRAYVSRVAEAGFSTTLFVHPEVAAAHRDMLLQFQDEGACLGLHVHPYKLGDGRYGRDLGAYAASTQRQILAEASAMWEEVLGQKPLYFRAGYFSANDSTFSLLQELGFQGGSLSIPGRILPQHCSVWAGADPYPHRAHPGFRQLAGESDFIEIPVSMDFERPTSLGAAGEQGYEWLYIAARGYDHRAITKDIIERIKADRPRYGVIVADTHNDQEYGRPEHPARVNLDVTLRSIERFCAEADLEPVDATVAGLCDAIRADPQFTSGA
jgi:peptidoglycan/xylan/chitin deacetylase (PgdA/CDA1 family)